MNKFNTWMMTGLMAVVALTGCRAIAGIFKAGVWVGIIIVVAIIFLIFWLIGKAGKKG